MHPTYPHLFTPLLIRRMRLPNRIVMPAMATNFASETGGVTPWMLSYYEARARGGGGIRCGRTYSLACRRSDIAGRRPKR